MLHPEASRKRIARTLGTAYADGLLSENTFVDRLEQLLKSRLVHPRRLIGDLNLRPSSRGMRARAWAAVASVRCVAAAVDRRSNEGATLLALDWSGKQDQLLVGRDPACDVVLGDSTVSRRHAQLFFRSGSWIVQDLESTNGTLLNGKRVGRCEVRPGDRLILGLENLQVD